MDVFFSLRHCKQSAQVLRFADPPGLEHILHALCIVLLNQRMKQFLFGDFFLDIRMLKVKGKQNRRAVSGIKTSKTIKLV